MSTITRAGFVESLQNKSVKLDDVQGVTARERAAITRADVNNDGVIAGPGEAARLFRQVDNFDVNGSLNSVDTSRVPVARMTEAIATAARPRTGLRGNTNSAPTSSSSSSPATATAATAATAAPPAGTINERVAAATREYMGTSTRRGPDRGNLACAWAVNNILRDAGLAKVGTNTNAVRSVEQGLQNGRGTRVTNDEARPGDIVIWPAPRSHIGIMSDDGKVANSSSGRATFSNLTTLPVGARVYRLNS